MKKYFAFAMVGMLALATQSFAATQAAGAATVSPTLQISATIQKAVSLTLSTGTTAPNHCAVTPGGGDYTMNFGDVDALGISNGNCNKIAPQAPGSDNAIYWSDYTITPVYTGHTGFSATTITAQVTSDFAAPHNIFVVRSSTATSSTLPSVSGDFTALNTAGVDTIGTAVASGTALTRFIGVAVTPLNSAAPAALQGLQSATVTFTLTVL